VDAGEQRGEAGQRGDGGQRESRTQDGTTREGACVQRKKANTYAAGLFPLYGRQRERWVRDGLLRAASIASTLPSPFLHHRSTCSKMTRATASYCLQAPPSLPLARSPSRLHPPVSVKVFKREDFPTEGKPINATRPSPLLATSNPVPAPPGPLLPVSNKSSDRSFAKRAFRAPRWCSVALFFWVRAISSWEGGIDHGVHAHKT